MNKPVPTFSLELSQPLTLQSPDLKLLFDHIAEGAERRDRERILPVDIIDLIRRSRLGALRIPAAYGGGGSTIRQLFDVVIRLGGG